MKTIDKLNSLNNTAKKEKNNSVNLSLVDTPIISENKEPVYTNAFAKVKPSRNKYLVKSRSIYGRKK